MEVKSEVNGDLSSEYLGRTFGFSFGYNEMPLMYFELKSVLVRNEIKGKRSRQEGVLERLLNKYRLDDDTGLDLGNGGGDREKYQILGIF